MTTITPAVGRAMADQLQRVRSGAGVANYLNSSSPSPRSAKPHRPVTWQDIERLQRRQDNLQRLLIVLVQAQYQRVEATKHSAKRAQTPFPVDGEVTALRETLSSTAFAQAQRKSLSTINRALNDNRVRMPDGSFGAYQQSNKQWRVVVGAVLVKASGKRA